MVQHLNVMSDSTCCTDICGVGERNINICPYGYDAHAVFSVSENDGMLAVGPHCWFMINVDVCDNNSLTDENAPIRFDGLIHIRKNIKYQMKIQFVVFVNYYGLK